MKQLDQPVRYYFGERWDSPMFDDGNWQRVKTPVGRLCLHCELEIVDGERGEFLGRLTHLDNGTAMGVIEPAHIECLMLATNGHQFGVCGCTGYGVDARARQAIIEAVDEQRAASGQGPWFSYVGPAPVRRVGLVGRVVQFALTRR